jgi:hypothetical protein
MMYRLRAAHRRADLALLGGMFAGLATAACILSTNLYTDQDAVQAVTVAEPAVAAITPLRAAADAARSETACLAEVLYYEARGEGVEGEKAVAEVVLERTHNRNFPATICGVVREGAGRGRHDCQFSFACDGAEDRPKERGAWVRAAMLAQKILSGSVRLAGETDHAVAFHNADVAPAWAATMLKTAQIGNHVFYRFAPHPLIAVAASVDDIAVDNTTAGDAASAPPPADVPETASDEIQTQVQTASAVGNGA